MSDGEVLGYITIKVPVVQRVDNGDLFGPPESYLIYDQAQLVEHDLSRETLAWLGSEIETGDVMCDFAMPAELKEQADKAWEEIR